MTVELTKPQLTWKLRRGILVSNLVLLVSLIAGWVIITRAPSQILPGVFTIMLGIVVLQAGYLFGWEPLDVKLKLHSKLGSAQPCTRDVFIELLHAAPGDIEVGGLLPQELKEGVQTIKERGAKVERKGMSPGSGGFTLISVDDETSLMRFEGRSVQYYRC